MPEANQFKFSKYQWLKYAGQEYQIVALSGGGGYNASRRYLLRMNGAVPTNDMWVTEEELAAAGEPIDEPAVIGEHNCRPPVN